MASDRIPFGDAGLGSCVDRGPLGASGNSGRLASRFRGSVGTVFESTVSTAPLALGPVGRGLLSLMSAGGVGAGLLAA